MKGQIGHGSVRELFSVPAIMRALCFIDSLRVDDARSEYFEVAERNHIEGRARAFIGRT